MHVSRIAKETSKLTDSILPTSRSTRLQTRRFAQSLSTYAANGASTISVEAEEEVTQELGGSDDSSELSSAGSAFSMDIEDVCVSSKGTKKRKLDANSPSTTRSSTTTSTGHRTQSTAGIQTVGESSSNGRKARKQPAKKVVKNDGEVEIHPPPRWEEIYEAVREMRKKVLAPVDTMGCETLAEENISPRVCDHTTISIIAGCRLMVCFSDRTNASKL